MAQLPKRSRTFRAIVKDQGEEQKRQRSTTPFAGTGMSPTDDGGMMVDGTMTIGGELNVTGDTVIGGTLSLPKGIIDNDALTSPISPLTAHTDGTNFSLATGPNVAKLTVSVPVPSGYTRALVITSANMNANNTSASADYAYLGLRINGDAVGWSLAAYAPPLIYCNVSNSASALLTGLGSSFTVQAAASSASANWAADVNNTINLDAIVMFLR